MTAPAEPFTFTIRFATSISDLSLTVPSLHTTTVLSLKQLVRAHLTSSNAQSRLRLIHAGRVLPDAVSLSSVIKPPSRSPLRPPTSDTENSPSPTIAETDDDDDLAASNPSSSLLRLSAKRKGKQPVRDILIPPQSIPLQPQQPRVYVHCSIGDILTPDELAEEAETAAALEESLQAAQLGGSVLGTGSDGGFGAAGNGDGAAHTGMPRAENGGMAAAPQGFDRLLSAGFTASEIAALRSQFLANISFTHTPDTMPSGNALRALEDHWLDSTAQDGDVGMGMGEGGEVTGGWGGGFGAEDGGLEDMLYGNLIGFFWPLGALCWGMREEGVWTKRRMIAICAGIAINVLFGFIQLSS